VLSKWITQRYKTGYISRYIALQKLISDSWETWCHNLSAKKKLNNITIEISRVISTFLNDWSFKWLISSSSHLQSTCNIFGYWKRNPLDDIVSLAYRGTYIHTWYIHCVNWPSSVVHLVLNNNLIQICQLCIIKIMIVFDIQVAFKKITIKQTSQNKIITAKICHRLVFHASLRQNIVAPELLVRYLPAFKALITIFQQLWLLYNSLSPKWRCWCTWRATTSVRNK
jgi:hypothetical protein